MIKRIFISSFIILLSFYSKGQDLHFTQFNASPLYLNPAFTGVFDYDYKNKNIRAGSIFRQQWRTVPSAFLSTRTPFNSTSFSVDAKIHASRIFNKDYIGLGMIFYRDKAGDLDFGANQVNLSVSYNKALNQDASKYLTVGIQGGTAQRFIDFSNASFDNQWNNQSHNYDPTRSNGENFSQNRFSYPDLSAGISYSHMPSQGINFRSGIALYHFNKPMQNFFPTQEYSIQLYRKLVVHSDAQIPTNTNLFILPGVLYLRQGPASEMNISSYFKIRAKNQSKMLSYQFGPGFRIVGNYLRPISGDALTLAYKFTYNNIVAGISYDANISTLKTATRTVGAFEVSLLIHEKFPRDPKKEKFRKERIQCPKF